ncbi:hypothetical protein [Pseudoalteromonas sp. J010]|uniref:hypothetical protein n=1 Tax=Pseudoalteromonas sp. J010 TaxID=998465 RepID=UPI001639DF90|nr:hypothetical protein [Pseudoalteromonas sp. J010]
MKCDKQNTNEKIGLGLAIGVGIGAAVGVASGQIMYTLPIGIAMAILIGRKYF